MRTLEDFFRQEAEDLEIGTSKSLLDQDADQLMLVAKVDDATVSRVKKDVRSFGVFTSATHLENRHDVIGISFSGGAQSEDIITYAVPLHENIVQNLWRVIRGERSIHAAIVGAGKQDVYGIRIYENDIAKKALEIKLNFILNG